MSQQFTLNAVARSATEQGKGASRRLRKQNLIPAIIYGGNEEPVAIAIKNNELVKALESEAFFSSILSIVVDGTEHQGIIKALQRHPAKGFALHADFQRIVRGQKMNFHVPIHFVNKDSAVGVKSGGIFTTLMTDIEIECLPRNLPEFIEVDVASMDIGDAYHLSDIKLPEGIHIIALENDGENRTIANIQPPAAAEATDADVAETAEEGDSEE